MPSNDNLLFGEMLFNKTAARQVAKDKQAKEEARRAQKQEKMMYGGDRCAYNGPYLEKQPRHVSSPSAKGSPNPASSGSGTDCTETSTALVVRPVDPHEIEPGPAVRDTLPLRALFADHVEHVSRIPLLVNNMPMYYAIVSEALDRALEEAEFALRTQSLQNVVTELPPEGV